MKEGQPKAIYLKDYKVPPFIIEEVQLHVDIQEPDTFVTTTLKVHRNPEALAEDAVNLVLNGSSDLRHESISLDGRELSDNEFKIQNLLIGNPHHKLQSPSKIVRIFTSSTFTG